MRHRRKARPRPGRRAGPACARCGWVPPALQGRRKLRCRPYGRRNERQGVDFYEETPPGSSPGVLLFTRQVSPYRLTCTLVPLPGVAPRAPSPLETTLTQSASSSLKYEVSPALRSASRLLCCAPEAAVVNPGRSKITHEPASISVRVRFRDGLSVASLISVPALTLVLVTV